MRAVYGGTPENLEWEELLKLYGDATFVIQLKADMTAASVAKLFKSNGEQ